MTDATTWTGDRLSPEMAKAVIAEFAEYILDEPSEEEWDSFVAGCEISYRDDFGTRTSTYSPFHMTLHSNIGPVMHIEVVVYRQDSPSSGGSAGVEYESGQSGCYR